MLEFSQNRTMKNAERAYTTKFEFFKNDNLMEAAPQPIKVRPIDFLTLKREFRTRLLNLQERLIDVTDNQFAQDELHLVLDYCNNYLYVRKFGLKTSRPLWMSFIQSHLVASEQGCLTPRRVINQCIWILGHPEDDTDFNRLIYL